MMIENFVNHQNILMATQHEDEQLQKKNVRLYLAF